MNILAMGFELVSREPLGEVVRGNTFGQVTRIDGVQYRRYITLASTPSGGLGWKVQILSVTLV